MQPYYQDEAVTLYHADCLDFLAIVDDPEECVGGGESGFFFDHVITDPPYSKHTHEKQRHGSGKKTNPPRLKGDGKPARASISRTADLGFEHLDPVLRLDVALRIGALVDRWVLVFSDVESCHEWRTDLVKSGMEYVRTAAWIKTGSTPQFTGDRPAVGYETITICHAPLPARKRWNGGGSHGVWTYPIVQNRSGRGGGVQRGGEGRWHTTQKPIALMHELVRLFTDPGETILDPFAGSGTTLLAAKNLGRKAVGVEIDERHCESVAKRLAQQLLPGTAG